MSDDQCVEAQSTASDPWTATLPGNTVLQSSSTPSINSSIALGAPPSYDSVMNQRGAQSAQAITRRAYEFAEGSDCDEDSDLEDPEQQLEVTLLSETDIITLLPKALVQLASSLRK